MRQLSGVSEANAFLAENPIAVLMFGATWCAPCKVLKPKVEEISASLPHVPLAYCDVESHSQLVQEMEIMSVPTVILVVDGDGTEEVVGTVVDRVRALFEKASSEISSKKTS